MLYDFIVKLQKDLELKEPLGALSDSSFSLSLEDSVVTIMDASPGFKLYCNLGPLPEQKLEDFFAIALRANLFGQSTHFSTLGLDETGNYVLLQFHYPKKATYQEFHNCVEDFINVVDFWKTQIKNHPAPIE